MPTAVLSDGSAIDFTIQGQGMPLLLSVSTADPTPGLIDEFRRHGLDPYLGRNLISMLAPHARVISFDYEAHMLQHPRPSTFTVDSFAEDVLAIASAAGADRFAYYGYSWLALAGLQLAGTSKRLTGLAVGGFAPVEAPLSALLEIARRNHRAAVTSHMEDSGSTVRGGQTTLRSSGSAFAATNLDLQEPAVSVMRVSQARQFVTLFADTLKQAAILSKTHSDMTFPRLCFVGSEDTLPTGGNQTELNLAEPLLKHQPALEEAGWTVRLLPGLDALEAMQPPTVAALLLPWLASIHSDTARAATTGSDCRTSGQHAAYDQRFTRGHEVSRDQVSSYLQECGVTEEWFNDQQLRVAVRNLLHFQAAHQRHTPLPENQGQDVQPAGNGTTTPRREPQVTPSKTATHVAASTNPPTIDEHHEELLEVAIISRLRELGTHENNPAADEGQMNRLHQGQGSGHASCGAS